MPSPLDLRIHTRASRGIFPVHCDAMVPPPTRFLILSSLLLALNCVSCGVVGPAPTAPPAPPAPATLNVMPTSAQPFPGGGVQFHALVENASNSAINWQVNQITGGNAAVGTISSTGFYTAPGAVPNPPTVTVTAALQSQPSLTSSATVTIQNLSAVQGPLTLSPRLASITTSQTIQINVLTTGVNNTDVYWAVDGAANGSSTLGTISPSGDYSPSLAAGPHLITAILKANPAAIGSATIEVTGFPGTLTWRNDNARSGINSEELALAPSTVNSSTFGKLFSCPVDGYIYAQPLYVSNLAIPGNGPHNVLFVATENDSVYAFDADANPCVQFWHTSLLAAGSQAITTPNVIITSTDIVPLVGITGTPVIDINSSTLYAVAAFQTIGTSISSNQRLYALDLATGALEIKTDGAPISSPPGLVSAFSPTYQNQRAALLLDNGTVYVAFGSYGGEGEYNGWLFAYDSASLNQTGVFDVTPAGLHGGIWQSGGGPSADSNHNVFVVSGDGTLNVGRTEINYDYGNSFLRLANTVGLPLVDYFTPCDEASGQILGTTAPVLLPDSAGSSLQPHLLMGGSKGGSLYIVNRDQMGGYVGPCPDALTRVQTIPVGSAIFGAPLFWNDNVYVAPANGNLKSFAMTNGVVASTALSSQSPEQLGPQGATPVITSNAASNAILWLVDSSGALATPNTPAILRAYDPANLSNEIYSSAMAPPTTDLPGLSVKFTVPTVANGKVYVGTQTKLDVYGLLQ
ncbi:MAG TPA: hypothetical protein VK709_17945 [Candidatus Saccharimonadales bacterium]|jgi:hypothetical protein|nr:hypothetical protein [Candidatus Saccharimonadales bacterium]